MTRQEQLKFYVEKFKEIQTKRLQINEDWLAHNRMFNSWVQKELGISDSKGEVHLSEILSNWSELSDSASEASS